jgi:hypothetical protein
MIEKERLKWLILGMRKMIKIFLCLILGHKEVRFNYVNKMVVRINRKGGKRRNVGGKTFKTRHTRIYC